MKRPQKKFTIITDSHVHNIWKCSDCENKATVTPDWYQNNGTPVCESCDIDMEYSHTEVKL